MRFYDKFVYSFLEKAQYYSLETIVDCERIDYL